MKICDFSSVAAIPANKNYEKFTERQYELYNSKGEVRSPFARDYTRILHSTAYRRLKHKTQVFYNIESDHVCTRMEHVLHVESVSYTIAKSLKLNEELTRAIAMGHDLGHAPFGHHGEKVISDLSQKYLGTSFWHEKNGLYLVDKIELLPDHEDHYKNLNLTYAVRDGIISHCGEQDINTIYPRSDYKDLSEFKRGKDNPATYEGCVVKIADKISYVGRDIEDALTLNFLDEDNLAELRKIVDIPRSQAINTTTIMSNLIIDICRNSTIERGICLSDEMSSTMNKIKAFNMKFIYGNPRFATFNRYSALIINEIFNILLSFYDGKETLKNIVESEKIYPLLAKEFYDYIIKYTTQSDDKYTNEKIYENYADKKVYIQAILDYIAGMTDKFAVRVFNELITYK